MLTKDNINSCKYYEFRYACFDCRPIDYQTISMKNHGVALITPKNGIGCVKRSF
jgi:hypothetical protein